MWRIAFAVFLFLHGFAHQVGFLASWQVREFRDAPLDTTVLSRRLDVGIAGMRALGIGWLLTGLAFELAAVAVWREWEGWPSYTAALAAVSLGLSALAWPKAWIGVFLNLAILVGLAVAALPPRG